MQQSNNAQLTQFFADRLRFSLSKCSNALSYATEQKTKKVMDEAYSPLGFCDTLNLGIIYLFFIVHFAKNLYRGCYR